MPVNLNVDGCGGQVFPTAADYFKRFPHTLSPLADILRKRGHQVDEFLITKVVTDIIEHSQPLHNAYQRKNDELREKGELTPHRSLDEYCILLHRVIMRKFFGVKQ